jgi:hypothetical protein
MIVFLLVFCCVIPVIAVSGPVIYQGRYYYAVNSADPTEDTGAEVCAKAGASYIGFTALTTDVCRLFHPSAAVTQGVDGSSTGFYCNGPPQAGICAKETNTCNICPSCSLNVDRTTVISDQYSELYVECGALQANGSSSPGADEPVEIIPAPEFQPDIFTSIYSSVRLSVLATFWRAFDKDSLKKYLDDKYGCDFYQYPLANVKHVTCTSPGAADNFCKKMMRTMYAQSEYCGTDGALDGVIICSAPCAPAVWQGSPTIPAHCAYDVARNQVRGDDAPVSNCGAQTTPPQVSTTGMPNALARDTLSSGVALPRPTLGTGQSSIAAATATTTATATKLCPAACYLRTVGMGAAGNGYVNCEVDMNKIHTAQASCTGTETQLSIEKNQVPVSCSCPPVETVSEACPSQCATGSSICFVDPGVINKGNLPCGGTIHGTVNMHCTCIKKNGTWQLGSADQIF